jgi:plastocyanin
MSGSLWPMRYRRFAAPVIALTIAVSVIGCSSDSSGKKPTSNHADDSAGLPAQVVKLQGNDSLRFIPATLVVKPGRVQLVFTVTGKQSQTFSSRALNVDSGNVPPGHTVTLDVMAPGPGKYAFYSAYHKKQGMIGKIIVQN